MLHVFLGKDKKTVIALHDPGGGGMLSDPAMLENLQRDLVRRASNSFHQDQVIADRIHAHVCTIRSKGAPASGVPGVAPACPAADKASIREYDFEETTAILSSLQTTKACIRGSFSALKAHATLGHRVTHALMNLGAAGRVTSSYWAPRAIRHIWKSGPQVIREVECARPISNSTDMSVVQDRLWLSRTRDALDKFSGEFQVGGKSDAISLILAIVIVSQLRFHQGLPTILDFADQKWAYDTASLVCLLLATYEAGVVGGAWLLLDDFMRMDSQFVELRDLRSALFKLEAGVAQGKVWATHVFNALQAWLRDAVEAAIIPAHAWLPPFARQVLDAAALVAGVSSIVAAPRAPREAWKIAQKVVRVAVGEAPPWRKAVQLLVDQLALLSHESDRLAVLERLGHHPQSPYQYVDDFTNISPGAGASTAVKSHGYTAYASKARMQFNKGVRKTASMPLFGTPGSDMGAVPNVSSYPLLGVTLDSWLTMSPFFTATCHTAGTKFKDMHAAAKVSGLSMFIQAAQVSCDILPFMLYGAALFVDLDEAEEGFNRLQMKWARALVAGTSTAHISGLLAAVACGWEFRFGTLLLETIIMARARLFVLPQSHPAAVLAHLAGNVNACTWVRSTAALLQSPRFPRVIPDIAVCGELAAVDISAARSDRLVRQRVLRTYRDAVVRPVLRDYDKSAYLAASAKVQVRGLLHSSWCTGFWKIPLSLISWPATNVQNHAVRVWACLSTSGK